MYDRSKKYYFKYTVTEIRQCVIDDSIRTTVVLKVNFPRIAKGKKIRDSFFHNEEIPSHIKSFLKAIYVDDLDRIHECLGRPVRLHLSEDDSIFCGSAWEEARACKLIECLTCEFEGDCFPSQDNKNQGAHVNRLKMSPEDEKRMQQTIEKLKAALQQIREDKWVKLSKSSIRR